jgi:hypothetical protein
MKTKQRSLVLLIEEKVDSTHVFSLRLGGKLIALGLTVKDWFR